MAALSDRLKPLPPELKYMIISEATKLSYQDRARVACVSRECNKIADSEISYEAQYIRDFGHLPQDHSSCSYWRYRPHGWFHISAEPGSEPPKRWKFTPVGLDVQYVDQESSWKRAYIRRHNWLFPHELYTRLPALPYKQRHIDIVSKHRLKACQSPDTTLPYLRGLYMKSAFYLSELYHHAMLHSVWPDVELQLMLRGWVLCRSSLEPIRSGKFTRGNCLICSRVLTIQIPARNRRRQEKLQKAKVGDRSGMAQVPIEFETGLGGTSLSRMTCCPNDYALEKRENI